MTDQTPPLSRQDFRVRFRAALDEATTQTETQLGGRAARRYRIAFGEPGRRPLIELDAAVDRLFGTAPLFPVYIDIAVLELKRDETVLFVRPSDHSPVMWTETANVSSGRGPFKILVSDKVSDRRG